MAPTLSELLARFPDLDPHSQAHREMDAALAAAGRGFYGCRSTVQLGQWMRKEKRPVVRAKLAAHINKLLFGIT